MTKPTKTITISGTVPAHVDVETAIRVFGDVNPRGVRLIREGGCVVVFVRPTTDDEREHVNANPYAATYLGWHRGQCPSYGSTPLRALQRHVGLLPDDNDTGSACAA